MTKQHCLNFRKVTAIFLSLHIFRIFYHNILVMHFGWLVVLRLNVPVNNFSVISGRSHRFLGN